MLCFLKQILTICLNRKRIFRELKRECESNSLTGHRTALEDAKAAGEQVFLDVEKLDDDVIMIENGAPSSSQNKKRRGQH